MHRGGEGESSSPNNPSSCQKLLLTVLWIVLHLRLHNVGDIKSQFLFFSFFEEYFEACN